jgi:hypothetical protein
MSQHTWNTIDQREDKPVLKSTQVFKLKRLPDGTPHHCKARFCAHRDIQTMGIDFFETYAPVVQWSTVHLLLSTVLTENWTPCQVDYTKAFAQAELKEEAHVECPSLFRPKSGNNKVLHLLQSLYGLWQSPRTFLRNSRLALWNEDGDRVKPMSMVFNIQPKLLTTHTYKCSLIQLVLHHMSFHSQPCLETIRRV